MNHPYNPDHRVGTCQECGREMIFNVPRMGSAGGFVHADTHQIQCWPRLDNSPPILSKQLNEVDRLRDLLAIEIQVSSDWQRRAIDAERKVWEMEKGKT